MMSKKMVFITLPVFLLWCFSAVSICIAAEGDPCADQGITVRNLSLDKKWYKSQGDQCIPLKRNYSFTIHPKENIGVFLDMVCETRFCPSFTYTDYKSSDEDGNCRVKILPGCVLADM
jgi:hypothetical protein